MVYKLFGNIGSKLGKLVKALQLVLDIVGLLRLILGPIGVGIVTALIAYIKEMPWREIILLYLATFFIILIATTLIKRSSYDKQLLKYPEVLKALDNRNTKLALKVAKQSIDEAKLRQFEEDIIELLNLAPRILSTQRLTTKRMNFLEKR